MSIIWDDKKKEHNIYIDGQKKVTVKATDFSLTATKEQDEMSIKTAVDKSLSKHHMYIHVFDKPVSLSVTKDLNYVIWLGEIGTEPPKNWWGMGSDISDTWNGIK